MRPELAPVEVVPGAVRLVGDLLQDHPADPVDDVLELVGEQRPELVAGRRRDAGEVEAAGGQVEVAGVDGPEEGKHGLPRRVEAGAPLPCRLLLGRQPVEQVGHAGHGPAVEPPGAVAAPGQRDLPLRVSAEHQRVGLPRVGRREQVDAQVPEDRFELGGEPRAQDRAVVLRERAEVHAADQVPGESVVELQAVGRLQERPQRLARRGEPGGDATRGPRRLTCRGQHLLADRDAEQGVPGVGRHAAEALDQGVEVAQRAAAEEPGVLALGQPDAFQQDAAAVVRVPDVAVAVGLAGDLLGEQVGAPLHHEGELARHLGALGGPELGRDVAEVEAARGQGEVAAAHRRGGESPDRGRRVGPALGHPRTGVLCLALGPGGRGAHPPDQGDGRGVEPPSAVGLAGQRRWAALRPPPATNRSPSGRSGTPYRAIPSRLRMASSWWASSAAVALPDVGGEAAEVEAVDRVGDQGRHAVVAGDGEVERLEHPARRRPVVPPRDVRRVGRPGGHGRWRGARLGRGPCRGQATEQKRGKQPDRVAHGASLPGAPVETPPPRGLAGLRTWRPV